LFPIEERRLPVSASAWSLQHFPEMRAPGVALSFRYNTIGGQNPNELERVYGRASVAVYEGKITLAKDVFLGYLKSVYLDDNSFKNDFKNKQINTNKSNYLVKYILAKLEVQYGGAEPALTSKNLSIENILPENPTDEWVEFFHNVDVQDYIFRLGNFTLLEAGKNKAADRRSFAEKQAIYLGSNFKLSCEQTDFSEWNAASISSRQADMANKAASVWKIQY
jgi:hypothetical protein